MANLLWTLGRVVVPGEVAVGTGLVLKVITCGAVEQHGARGLWGLWVCGDSMGHGDTGGAPRSRWDGRAQDPP